MGLHDEIMRHSMSIHTGDTEAYHQWRRSGTLPALVARVTPMRLSEVPRLCAPGGVPSRSRPSNGLACALNNEVDRVVT
jgi:hypothetical protein